MGKPNRKLTAPSFEKQLKKGLCVICLTEPRDGISRKNKPYKTCAGCRVKSAEAVPGSRAADAAEVAEATKAAISSAQGSASSV
jgi:hypothetical protein